MTSFSRRMCASQMSSLLIQRPLSYTNRNATIIFGSSNILRVILVCFSSFSPNHLLFFPGGWQRAGAAHYCHRVFWNGSLHATGPVTIKTRRLKGPRSRLSLLVLPGAPSSGNAPSLIFFVSSISDILWRLLVLNKWAKSENPTEHNNNKEVAF